MKKLIILFLTLASLYGYAQVPSLNDIVRTNTLSPSKVSNALDGSKSFTATGTDTYAITTNLGQYSGVLTYAVGDMYTVTFTNANTSTTVTLNVDGEGVVSIKDNAGDDLAIGDLKAGGTYKVRFNGTNFRIIGATGSGGLTPPIDATDIADGSVNDTEFQYINSLTSNAQTQIDGKQTTLVSGTNIKTVNSNTLLGSGNLDVGDVTYAALMASRTFTSADDLDQSDNFRIVYTSSSSPFDVTVDLLSTGSQVTVWNKGSATITLVPGSGVTLSSTPVATNEIAIIVYNPASAPDVRVSSGGGGGGGTVTSASIVTANGFAGSVATATTTPAITISTTVTGVLKGNGTDINAATNADLPVMTSTVGGAVPTPPNNTTTFLRGDGTFATPAGGGDVSSNTATSVDGEVALFNGTTGKSIKRATGTGFAKLTSGVQSTVTPGTGVETWFVTPSWTNFSAAITGTAPFYSLASGGTLTGTNTITSNTKNQIRKTGTWTGTADNDYHELFDPSITGSSGNTTKGIYLNPAFTVTGLSGTKNIVLDIGGSFTGGTNPSNMSLRVQGIGYFGTTNPSIYNGRLWVDAGSANRVAILGSVEFTTNGTPSWSGVGIGAVGLNRQLILSGNGVTTDNDAVVFSALSYGANRSGVDLGIWNATLPTFTSGTFQANSLSGFRFNSTWPVLTTPMTAAIGFDYNPGGGGTGGNATYHYSFRGVNGSVLLGSSTIGVANTRLEVVAAGNTTELIQTWKNQSGTTMLAVEASGRLLLYRTITPPGTTGNQTINRPAGTVNIAAAGTAVTVTNSLVDANTGVYAIIKTNDATAWIKNVTSTSGAFTINLGAACTGEIAIYWEVRN